MVRYSFAWCGATRNGDWRSWEPLYRPGVKNAVLLEKIHKYGFPHDMEWLFVGWATPEEVLDELGNPMLTGEDERYLINTVDAANRAVAYWRPEVPVPIAFRSRGEFAMEFAPEFLGGASPNVVGRDPLIVRGTTMLAARWFMRKGGDPVAQFAEFGPPPAIDRDIEIMLRINRAAPPRIA